VEEEKINLPPTTANRPTERVAIALRLEVYGCDLDGRDFVDHASTKNISRGGASIVIDRRLGPHQTLTIKRVGSNHEAEVRVIGHLGSNPAGGELYGIALIDSATDIWGINFPAEKIDEPGVKVLLECPGCQTRQMVRLNEFELAVFEAKERLSRSCPKCRDFTLWRQTLYDASPDAPVTTLPPERLPSAQSDSVPCPTKPPNRRKHRRVKIGLKGCILFYGQDTPIEVTDTSRSGIRFSCRRSFTNGLLVRVAVPYTPGAANIYVSGRICWSRVLPSGLSEYGLEFKD